MGNTTSCCVSSSPKLRRNAHSRLEPYRPEGELSREDTGCNLQHISDRENIDGKSSRSSRSGSSGFNRFNDHVRNRSVLPTESCTLGNKSYIHPSTSSSGGKGNLPVTPYSQFLWSEEFALILIPVLS